MGELMKGKRGLVMGVANDHSIAWGIAQQLHQNGAELAFTYQERHSAAGQPLADRSARRTCFHATSRQRAIASVFDTLKDDWGGPDFIVRDRLLRQEQLKGRYCDTSRDSRHGHSAALPRSRATRRDDGQWRVDDHADYAGSVRVMPNYNVMGVAKAALEASVRYLVMISA